MGYISQYCCWLFEKFMCTRSSTYTSKPHLIQPPLYVYILLLDGLLIDNFLSAITTGSRYIYLGIYYSLTKRMGFDENVNIYDRDLVRYSELLKVPDFKRAVWIIVLLLYKL